MSATITQLAPHLELGQRGERLAAAYLLRQGFRLVAANFTLPVGRNRRGVIINAEIDLVAYEGETLCFIEVKTRTSDAFAAPEAAVDLRKQRQIIRTGRIYRRVFQLSGEPYRYDVVSVLLVDTNPEVTLLPGYFSDARFQRSNWLKSY